MLAESPFTDTISKMIWDGADIDSQTRDFFIKVPYHFCDPGMSSGAKAELVEKRLIALRCIDEVPSPKGKQLLTTVLSELIYAQPRR